MGEGENTLEANHWPSTAINQSLFLSRYCPSFDIDCTFSRFGLPTDNHEWHEAKTSEGPSAFGKMGRVGPRGRTSSISVLRSLVRCVRLGFRGGMRSTATVRKKRRRRFSGRDVHVCSRRTVEVPCHSYCADFDGVLVDR